MTKDKFNKAQYLLENIEGCEDKFKELKKLYQYNKEKKLSSTQIQWLIELADKSLNFVQNTYQKEFDNL